MVEGFSRHGGGSARICRQEGADRVEGRLWWWKVEDVVDSGGRQDPRRRRPPLRHGEGVFVSRGVESVLAAPFVPSLLETAHEGT